MKFSHYLIGVGLFVTAGLAVAQTGALEPGDLQLETGEYLDLHEVRADGPGMLAVAISSSEFDPYMALLDEAGEIVVEVDDSAGHGLLVNETIELPAAGLYTVAVTSAFPGETGTYLLELTFTPAGGPEETPPATGNFTLPDLQAPVTQEQNPNAEQVSLQSRIAPRPGFVTGTAFDTLGEPMQGAFVSITGTTFEQGQRTEFETVTGADGTYAVRVPDGRYQAKAWIDRNFAGQMFSRLLHPVTGSPNFEVDSTVGGNIDFQWRLTGLTAYSTPPGSEPSDFHGAAIDLSYCGLPATAYCTVEGTGVPATPIAPGGSTVTITLTPTGPLIDGSEGRVLEWRFVMTEQDPDYPYGGAAIPGYENGGGGRLTLSQDWQYHSDYLLDIPLGSYRMTATVTLPDGTTQPLRLGLTDDEVNYGSVPIAFVPWEDYSGRSYIGGGITELDVYIRD